LYAARQKGLAAHCRWVFWRSYTLQIFVCTRRVSQAIPHAVECFKVEDLKEFAHFYPLVYAGAGTVLENGGWMMARLDTQVSYSEQVMSPIVSESCLL
jgi:hypothetical protein